MRTNDLMRASMEMRRQAMSTDGRRHLRQRASKLVASYWGSKLRLLWQTARSNHTIVNAIAPPEEDILSSTLQDEQVIHIFWSTFLVELWMTFLISDENEGDFNLIATMYVGLLCSIIGGATAKVQASVFTFCNRKRRYQTLLDRLPGRIQSWRKMRRRRRRKVAKQKAAKAAGLHTAAAVGAPSRPPPAQLQRKVSPFTLRIVRSTATLNVPPADPLSRSAPLQREAIQSTQRIRTTNKVESPPPSPPSTDHEKRGEVAVISGGRGKGETGEGSSDAALVANARERWRRAGLVKAALRFSRRPPLTDEEKAAAAEQAELEAKEAERRKRMTLIPFSRSYILLRWTLGWLLNLVFYIVVCAMDFVYGVQQGPVAFGQAMLAWMAALIFTYLVVEPAEIAGIVFLPAIAENKHIVWCQDRAKYYGLY